MLDFGDEVRCAQCGRGPSAPVIARKHLKRQKTIHDRRFDGAATVMRQR